ncbi:MAG: DUF3977 family protein [Solibacillus sp.]|uniref:DUF3977 family protein n=1 Tax=unclassified Solibacillus TaxID=2637870 RepID=UPI0030FBBE66
MKFVEFGVGNRWLLRTEIEQQDGTEYEQKGIVGPIKYLSCYIRVWIGKRVVILDSKEGLKKSRKARNAVKLILGIKSL